MADKISKKQEQEQQILFGLIDLFIKTGRPIGSHTLKEAGFEHISSATIRNYCGKLEESGYLKQQHSSGGRIPTDLAYQFYAKTPLKKETISKKVKQQLEQKLTFEGKEVAAYLQQAAKLLAATSHCAVFLSSPRFDQDFITDIKFVLVDSTRLLAVMVTSFGLVHTELFDIDLKLSQLSLKRLELYFRYKMESLQEKPELDKEELLLADTIYNEIMLKRIVAYANFITADVIKAGYSELLHYPELHDAAVLSNTLSLLENPFHLEKICQAVCHEQDLKYWIGQDLEHMITPPVHFSVIAVPYYVHQKPVGALGILGPTRIPYKELFEILRIFSNAISDTLTSSLFKHQISYRVPQAKTLNFEKEQSHFIKQTHHLLLDHRPFHSEEDHNINT